MFETDGHLATANAFIRNAYIITPWTTLTDIQRLFPNLEACDGYWCSRVYQGLPSDRSLVAVKMRNERIVHWVSYVQCTDPTTFVSTEASISSQLNHRLGKAKERWDGDGVRHRTYYPSRAEVVRLHRRTDGSWGEGTILILSRKFRQPIEPPLQPQGLEDLAL